MPPNASAVIFDLGGVILWDVWERMYFDNNGIVKKYNLSEERASGVGNRLFKKYAYNIAYGNANWQKTEIGYWTDFIDEFKDELPISTMPGDFIKITDKFIYAINEVEIKQILERLKSEGIKMAICSNQTNFWFERAMSKYRLDNYFSPDNIILSYKIGKAKSNGFKMFKETVRTLSVPKEQCIFFDDRKSNITHAKKFGMRGILVSTDSIEIPSIIASSINKYMGVQLP